MTQENIEKLQELYSEFETECERVGKIICKVSWESDYDYEYADECFNWSIEKDNVRGGGFDKYGEHVSCYFPIYYLTLTDDTLYHIVRSINDEIAEKHRQEKQKKDDAVRKRELSELKRLQEKYKNEL